jgi:hypothetical protein
MTDAQAVAYADHLSGRKVKGTAVICEVKGSGEALQVHGNLFGAIRAEPNVVLDVPRKAALALKVGQSISFQGVVKDIRFNDAGLRTVTLTNVRPAG